MFFKVRAWYIKITLIILLWEKKLQKLRHFPLNIFFPQQFLPAKYSVIIFPPNSSVINPTTFLFFPLGNSLSNS